MYDTMSSTVTISPLWWVVVIFNEGGQDCGAGGCDESSPSHDALLSDEHAVAIHHGGLVEVESVVCAS